MVFLEAWRHRAAPVIGSDMVLPWLYGVATNVLNNQRRSLRRQRAALQRVPDAGVTPDFADAAADRLDAEAQMRALLDAIADLSSRDQEVLALCCWQGLSYEETAVALAVPVGTVRSRLARARARVETRIEGAAA